MSGFVMNRKELADLLLSLKGISGKEPLTVIQETWMRLRGGQEGRATTTSTSLPPIIDKIVKMTQGSGDIGFSINEIVALGNQLEFNTFSSTTVQNWIKRDVKELIGSPALSKKYSVDQAATILMIEDLKTILDLDSIRKLLKVVFRNPDEIKDDLMQPVELYAAYSHIFEEMDVNDDQVLDAEQGGKLDVKAAIERRADQYVATAAALEHLSDKEKETMSDVIVIAILAVQTSYFQSLAKRAMTDLFLTHL